MEIDLNNDAGLLQILADEIRGKTLKLLADAQDNELFWAPKGLANHILWHAGHAVWLQDLLCIEAITGKSELPADWYETFSKFCQPVAQTTNWPTRSTVREQLERQGVRLIEVIGTLTKDDLRSPPRAAKLGTDRTLSYWITHGLHDEANHQGEIRLLLKMQRANREPTT